MSGESILNESSILSCRCCGVCGGCDCCDGDCCDGGWLRSAADKARRIEATAVREPTTRTPARRMSIEASILDVRVYQCLGASLSALRHEYDGRYAGGLVVFLARTAANTRERSRATDQSLLLAARPTHTHTTISHPSIHPHSFIRPSTHHIHPQVRDLTAMDTKRRVEPELEQSIREWLAAVLGSPLPSSQSIADALYTGEQLCLLVNHIRPGIVKRINHSPMIAFKQMVPIDRLIDAVALRHLLTRIDLSLS